VANINRQPAHIHQLTRKLIDNGYLETIPQQMQIIGGITT
jgi:hypothetical protein